MTARTDDIVNAVNKILDENDSKMTLRQIYYQLVAALVFPNSQSMYKSLGKVLVTARKNRDVDYRKIEDRVRKAIGGDHESEPIDGFVESWRNAFLECDKYYHRPRWFNQPEYVEVWVEKDALSRIISDIAGPLGVTTCVARGYSSFSFIKEAVNRINHACDVSGEGWDFDNRFPHIMYFGDQDPSGANMVTDLETRLEEYGLDMVSFEEGDIVVTETGQPLVTKVALNMEQIKKYKLPPMPVKMSDPRAKGYVEQYGTTVVELDALNPKLLKAMVNDCIVQHIDKDVWESNIDKEKSDKEDIKERVKKIVGDEK